MFRATTTAAHAIATNSPAPVHAAHTAAATLATASRPQTRFFQSTLSVAGRRRLLMISCVQGIAREEMSVITIDRSVHALWCLP